MGMDLTPINPSADAPVYPMDYAYAPFRGRLIEGRYNWSGWSFLQNLLNEQGVDLSEFSGYNDGEVISEATCLKVADAIEAALPTLSEREREWLTPHIQRWRTCGGYEQR